MINSQKLYRNKDMNNHLDLASAIAVNAATVSGAAVATYLRPELDLSLLILLALVSTIDFFTGITASYRIGQPITSRKWKLGFFSKMSLILAVGATCLVIRAFFYDPSTFLVWLFFMFCMAELYSIWGNLHTIWTGERKLEGEAVAAVIKQIRRGLIALFENGEKK
jgi:phage-related holin